MAPADIVARSATYRPQGVCPGRSVALVRHRPCSPAMPSVHAVPPVRLTGRSAALVRHGPWTDALQTRDEPGTSRTAPLEIQGRALVGPFQLHVPLRQVLRDARRRHEQADDPEREHTETVEKTMALLEARKTGPHPVAGNSPCCIRSMRMLDSLHQLNGS